MKKMSKKIRIEQDAIGKKKIPSDAYTGIFHARAKENFSLSARKFPMLFYHQLALLKRVAAQEHVHAGRIEAKQGNAIIRAAREIEKGKLTNTGLIDFISENTQKEIPISDIRALDRRVGSKALLYAGIGSGLGLIVSLATLAQIEADPHSKMEPGAWVAFPIGIALFGLTGLIVGSASDDWERVPLNASLKADFNKGSYQLSMKINF